MNLTPANKEKKNDPVYRETLGQIYGMARCAVGVKGLGRHGKDTWNAVLVPTGNGKLLVAVPPSKRMAAFGAKSYVEEIAAEGWAIASYVPKKRDEALEILQSGDKKATLVENWHTREWEWE